MWFGFYTTKFSVYGLMDVLWGLGFNECVVGLGVWGFHLIVVLCGLGFTFNCCVVEFGV